MSSQLFDGGASCLRWRFIEALGTRRGNWMAKAFLSHEHVRPELEEGEDGEEEKKIEKTCHLVKAFFPIRLFF
jgi:hypothetical protein